jgi:predicted nucleic acid-binding protein
MSNRLPDRFVLDCSATVPWYFDDESTPFSERLLTHMEFAEQVFAPSLWVLELATAINVGLRRGRIDEHDYTLILDQARELPVQLEPSAHRVHDIARLARQYDLTPYDATYFELARRLALPLATLDAQLVAACRKAGVPTITDDDALGDTRAIYRIEKPAAPGRRTRAR